VAGGVIGVVVGVPLLALLLELAAAPAGALATVGSTLGAPALWALLARSLALAAAVTLVALALGVPLGVLLGRTDVPGRRWALALHAFPMFVPPFLLALGWFHLLGQSGLVGTPGTARVLFSAAGVVGVLGLAFAPVVTTLTALALQAVDPGLEEAARVVAPPGRVLTRILLPVAWPAVALALLVVFALAFSELGVPMFLRVRAYPAAVFARLGGFAYAPGEAVALVLPLGAVTLALLGLERRALGERPFAVLGLRGAERAPLPLGRRRWAAAGACWGAALVGVAPLAALALRAGRAGFVAAPAWIGASWWNGLLAGALAATASVAVGLVTGHALARRRPGARGLDTVTMLAFVTPASVLGVGLVAAWNRPATHFLYGSLAVVVLAFVARYAVIAARVIAITVAQSSASLEEAAAAAGAGYGRRLRRIVLPMHARGVGAAWLLTLVFCLRDLETVALVYPPGGEPLTVRIFTLEANGPEPVIAALALVQVLMTAALLAAGGLLLAKRRHP